MEQHDCNEILDSIGNTLFLAAAVAGEWTKVRQMLHQGADARHKNSFGQNALYYALCDSELDLAIELFDAGARLDALCIPDGGGDHRKGKGIFLCNIAEMRRTGRDIFFDEESSIVELCCRGFYSDAERKIGTSPQEELSLALTELIRHAKYMEKENLALAKKLLDHGGELDIETLECHASMRPVELRNSEGYTAALRNYHPSAPVSAEETALVESSLSVGRFRAELEILTDGTLRIFLPYETEENHLPNIPTAVSVQNIGNGLLFSVADSRLAGLLLNTVNQFSEGK